MTAIDFAAFYHAVHDVKPFPWQADLAARVLEAGWPDGVDVATGLGKTSLLDIAVFVAAMGCPEVRRRRIFFVVDRRVIVDQAYLHAERLRDRLAGAESGVLGDIARRLREHAAPGHGDVAPVALTRMRGGLTWESRWMDRPDQVGIVVGTVDQIGSRMFFRAYGSSTRMAPIDAALTGTDSLVFLDEAHLAEPFTRTVTDAISRTPHTLSVPPRLVALSATHAATDGDVYRLDVTAHRDHPEAGRRLGAAKELHLVEVPAKTPAPAAMAAMAFDLVDDDHRVIAIFANTVATARAVHSEINRLRANDQESDADADAALFLGRNRPYDRDRISAAWLDRIGADRTGPPARPIFVVTTQTLECGADIDVDAMVTENASWDALVQRIGRVNRRGHAATPAPVLVVSTGGKRDDPVYGQAAKLTWAALAASVEPVPWKAHGIRRSTGLDVSPLALGQLTPLIAKDAYAPSPRTPLLLSPTLEAWAHTAPRPDADPPLEAFLHGIDTPRQMVAIAWRADLSADHLSGTDADAKTSAVLSVMPVRAEETIDVPRRAAIAWLHGLAAEADTTDHDGLDVAAAAYGDHASRVARPTEDGEWSVIYPSAIRPGDQIVVPATYGGLDAFGWAPDSDDAVPDIGDLTPGRHTRYLRLHPDVIAPHTPKENRQQVRAALTELRTAVDRLTDDHELSDLAHTALTAVKPLMSDEAGAPAPYADLIEQALRANWRAQRTPARDVLLTSRRRRDQSDTTTGSAWAERRVSLNAHQKAVSTRARAFADALRLPPELATAVELAALHHDEGKRDARFQAMLAGGPSWLTEIADELLAKSGMNATDRRAYDDARRQAGYPKGARHELLSARIVRTALADQETALARTVAETNADPQLLIHLIAAHHGWGRPLHNPDGDDPQGEPMTVELGGDTITVTPDGSIDWDSPHRFAVLNRRYGWWGLALLEACVRLADMSCSEEGT